MTTLPLELHEQAELLTRLISILVGESVRTSSSHPEFVAKLGNEINDPATTVARAVALLKAIVVPTADLRYSPRAFVDLPHIVSLLRRWNAVSRDEAADMLDILRTVNNKHCENRDAALFDHPEFFMPAANAEDPSNKYCALYRRLHLAILDPPRSQPGAFERLIDDVSLRRPLRDTLPFPGTYHITLPWLLKMFLSFFILIVLTFINAATPHVNEIVVERHTVLLAVLLTVMLVALVCWQIGAGLWSRRYVSSYMGLRLSPIEVFTRTTFFWKWLVSSLLLVACAVLAGLLAASLGPGSVLRLLAALSIIMLIWWLLTVAHFVHKLLKTLPGAPQRGPGFQGVARALLVNECFVDDFRIELTLKSSLSQIVVSGACLLFFAICSIELIAANSRPDLAKFDKWTEMRAWFTLFHVAFVPQGLELLTFVAHWCGAGDLPRMRWLWLLYIVVFIWFPTSGKSLPASLEEISASILSFVDQITAEFGPVGSGQRRIGMALGLAVFLSCFLASIADYEAAVTSTHRSIFRRYIVELFAYFKSLDWGENCQCVLHSRFDQAQVQALLVEKLKPLKFTLQIERRLVRCLETTGNTVLLVNDCSYSKESIRVYLHHVTRKDSQLVLRPNTTWFIDTVADVLESPQQRGRRHFEFLLDALSDSGPYDVSKFKRDDSRSPFMRRASVQRKEPCPAVANLEQPLRIACCTWHDTVSKYLQRLRRQPQRPGGDEGLTMTIGVAKLQQLLEDCSWADSDDLKLVFAKEPLLSTITLIPMEGMTSLWINLNSATELYEIIADVQFVVLQICLSEEKCEFACVSS